MVVQVVKRPLCLRLAAAESIHQQIEADRLLRPEPLLVLDTFGVVEPILSVAVYFLEAPLFEELNELGLGVRCNDDIQVSREACIERSDSVSADKDVLVSLLSEFIEQLDECITPVVEIYVCARSVSR